MPSVAACAPRSRMLQAAAGPRRAAAPAAAALARAPARRAPRGARVVAFKEEDAAKRAANQKHDPKPGNPSPLEPLSVNVPGPPLGAPLVTGLRPHPTGRPYAITALAVAAAAAGFLAYPHQAMDYLFAGGAAAVAAGGGAAGKALSMQVARLLGISLAMGAATNIAESRAGGRAGGVSEPVLESDTNIRLDKSLSAYGFLTTLIAALAFTPLAARLLPGYVSGPAIMHPYAAAAVALVGAVQWWVAGLASPVSIIKGLFRDFLGTPSRANNFNSATYALLGATFVAAGLSYTAFPAQTLAAVFGRDAGAAAGPAAALMWQAVGAGVSCVVAGACYSLKEGASFSDLTETKFKWLNFGLAAAALGHVIMLGPLAAGQGGPLAPVLLAVWALAMLMGSTNAFA